MSDPLTPAEWKRALSLPPGVVYGFHESEGSINRHALAAICLYNTPQGFTQADVELLRDVAKSVEAATKRQMDDMRGVSFALPEIWPWEELSLLADRICALLPPAPPTTEPR